ncbi:MAG: TraC family protein, partial [Myxococcaceae bacterium]|nr:TraC family protein [Myxococcaceae bacterium]
MLFANLAKHSEARHREEVSALKAMRNALTARLQAAGLPARPLDAKAVRGLVFALLNPTHAAKGLDAPEALVRANLFDEGSAQRYGDGLREYTEAEQLCLEDVVEGVGHLRQEAVLRRVLTLKVLPESGTDYLSSEALLGLVEKAGDDVKPFPFWLSVVVRVEDQARAKLKLNTSHNLVDVLSSTIPFLKTRSVQRDAEQAAKRAGIEGLFVELNAMASKVVALSVSLLLEADSLEVLDSRTQAARAAFSAAGNSELLLEEVTQLPALLSMLPGAGRYQLREKVCTSRNAADFLPVVSPWTGCQTAATVLWTPTRDVFRFDFFDASLPAHHGLVWADTGSGKSVTLGALTLDAMAAGHHAILVDNGRSWERLTRLFGGIHLDVDIKTPLTPFLPRALVQAGDGALESEAVEDVVSFLELCVRDTDLSAFTKLQTRLVARAVADAYTQLGAEERPLMRHFRDAILRQGRQADAHPDDRAMAESLYRRLGLFVGDELYGRFLDRPSSLRFDAPLVCFEMEGVAKSPTAKGIAFATVMRAISARAAQQRKTRTLQRTLVEIDEGHTWLGQGEVAERFLETSYRVMRKYG